MADGHNEHTISVNLTKLNELVEREQEDLRPFYSLTCLNGPAKGRQLKLTDSLRYSIGRSDECDVRVEELSVSRVHAIFSIDEELRLLIKDEGSRNGTFVNGERLLPGVARILTEGNKVRLGDEVVYRVCLNDKLDEKFQNAMYEAAVKDSMTGCFNKRYLHENLHREMALSQRHRLPLSVIIFDVDHFKKINDTYGHAAGDMVLTQLAKVIHDTLRIEDLIARVGGEEFVLVAKNQALLSAGVFAERVRKIVAEKAFVYEDQRIPVTISLGVASTSVKPYEGPEEILRDADAALYRAKHGGRNRVEVTAEHQLPPPTKLVLVD